MSRLFTGGAFNYITFGPGSAPTVQGPITLACLVKPATITGTHWWWTGRATSTHVWSILTDTSKLFMENDFVGGPTPTIANWWWVVVTKASGAALPRWHMKNVTTGAAWVHSNEASGTVPNNTGPITNILFGGDGSSTSTNADMKGAAAATWGSVLSDLAIEAACTLNASDLKAATPSWMIRLNQASTATAVVDDTGGTGGQTAITGTSVDAADDPPGFNYALTTTITKDVVERYRVTNAVTKDLAESYRVTNAVAKDSVETYRVLNGITKNLVESYRVTNGVTKNTAESYRVLNSLTKNVAESYRVLNAGTKDVAELYRVFNSITKDVVETYSVLGQLSKDVIERYRVYNGLTKDVTEAYRVLNARTVDRVEVYRVLNASTIDRVERYRVTNAFTKDLAEFYTVLGTTGVIKDVVDSWRVFNRVTLDRLEAYRVLNGRTADLVERYSVLTGGVVDRVERYRVLNTLSRSLVERYDVGDLGPTPVAVIDATANLGPLVGVATLTPTLASANLNGPMALAYVERPE